YYTVRMDYRCEKFMEEEFNNSIDALADSMARYFPTKSAAGWKAYLSEPMQLPKEKRPRAKKVIPNISYTEYQKLRTFPFFSIKNPNRNGVTVEQRMKRSTPYGDMARRSIGGVGEQNNREIRGISGLEMALDSFLFGQPGKAKKIPLTHHIVNWTDVAPVDGYHIKTTIDIKLQDIVENELNSVLETVDAEWGVAVLMEVETGDIKAISNLEKSKTTGQYIEGMNRAVLGFEPGSVVKPISMLLALEDGLVSNINQSIPIGASYAYAGGRAITDSHFNSALTVKGVIEESSNIGMTRIITNSAGPYHNDPTQFHKRLAEIGFLEPMNTGIAGERVPNVPATKSRVSLSRMCYGYATEIPPLYTLSIYNAIANGGRYVRPRLVKELIGADFDSVLPVTYIRDRICSEKNAQKLREMLTAVVWGDRGTARAWVRDENVAIAGKTGTCYMIENGHYNTQKKRLAFCGFFPAEDPKYSCIVLTCYPKQQWTGAASTSGQVMKNIARKMYSRGMLGNSSDYREIAEEGTQPLFYATSRPSSRKFLTQGLDITSAKEMASNVNDQHVEGRVPSVVGLGLREAVVKIEEAGFNVSFSGNGYVRSQSPGAGQKLKEGESVRLSLNEF
ncbi:MAG: PASTA domain-containing protein, partial [Muribaculaceae bacterium]|nr:PASTA domain-containing protein [Muribaculaceae bacterium]